MSRSWKDEFKKPQVSTRDRAAYYRNKCKQAWQKEGTARPEEFDNLDGADHHELRTR